LENFLERSQQPAPPANGLRAEVLGDRSYINIRGNSDDPGFLQQSQKVLGQSLPAQPNTTSFGDHTIYWLGPNEWLICSIFDDANTLTDSLQTKLDGQCVAINDLSGGMVTIRLSGNGIRRLMSKGCTLDFHPDVFVPGTCGQSGLAKASVLIGCTEDGCAFDIIVRRSFADYLAQWMHKAGHSEGIEFL